AAALLLAATTGGGTRRRRRTCRAGAARARGFILFGFQREPGSGARRFFSAEALFGHLAGLAFGFFVVLATIFFLALAGVGGFALATVHRLAAGAAAGLLFGDLALFRLAYARVSQCMGASRAFFFRQGPQNHA